MRRHLVASLDDLELIYGPLPPGVGFHVVETDSVFRQCIRYADVRSLVIDLPSNSGSRNTFSTHSRVQSMVTRPTYAFFCGHPKTSSQLNISHGLSLTAFVSLLPPNREASHPGSSRALMLGVHQLATSTCCHSTPRCCYLGCSAGVYIVCPSTKGRRLEPRGQSSSNSPRPHVRLALHMYSKQHS